MTTAGRIRLSLVTAVFALAALAPAAHAALLPAQVIDAGTGKDSVEVGGAIGNHRAWAGFVQDTGGAKRLYADFAINGQWAKPFLADRGNEVKEAGVTGNGRGAAVAVFVEKVNGKQVLFGRRLTNGSAGNVAQISAAGEDVDFESLMAPFLRGRKLTLDDSGGAAVCYRDAAGNKEIIATAPAGSDQWTEHEAGNPCTDMVADRRGDVVSVGITGGALYASRVVGGQASTEKILDDAMDQPSVGVSPSGKAIALTRDKNFQVAGAIKADISQATPWQSLGRLDSDTVFNPGDSPEEPRVALDDAGNGLIVFHSNSNNDPKVAYNALAGGQPQGAKLLSNQDKDRSFPFVTMLAPGRPVAAFNLEGTGVELFPFAGATPPSAGLQADPAMTANTLESAAGFVSDGQGDLLTLLYAGTNPRRTAAVLGDFAPPALKPSARPRRPRAGKTVTLRSGAADSFAALRKADVRWTLPRGVKALHGKTGLSVRVRFAKARRYVIRVAATDRGGNTATARLVVSVRRALKPRR